MLNSDLKKTRKFSTTMLIVFSIISVMPMITYAVDWLYCNGATDWGGSDGGGDNCGICDNPDGTYIQNRTVGFCDCTYLPINCIYKLGIYYQTRERTVQQNTVGAEEYADCESEKTDCYQTAQNAHDLAMLLCDQMPPPLDKVCEADALLILALDQLACDCEFSECVYECEISVWSCSNPTAGCI